MERRAYRRFLVSRWAGLGLSLIVTAIVVFVGLDPLRLINRSGRAAREAIEHGQMALKLGSPRQALKDVAAIREDGPYGAEVLTVKGLAFAALNDTERARQALERSLSLQPDQAMAAKVMAAICFDRNEDVKGIEYLDRAAAIDRADFRPWYAIGEAFIRLGQADEAAVAFRRALERRPSHVESKVGLLTALVVTRPPEESTALLRELLRARPNDPKIHVLAAWNARALGDVDGALLHADTAVQLNGDMVEAIVIRAQLNHMAGKSREAMADAEHVVELDPNNLSALSLLAQLQAAAGQSERSRATFARHRAVLERAERIRKLTAEIDKRPEDPEPRWKLGQVAAEGGLANLAVRSYRAALSIDPRCRQAIEGLRALEKDSPGSGSARVQSSLLPLTTLP
jgi:cytochrome c-type biogenesis protein CcmH/NrfG